MKSFKQMFVEADANNEFEYTVKCTEDITTKERLDLIKQAAIPHRFCGIEVAGYKPPMIANPDFPSCPNSPSYTVKVFTGIWVHPEIFKEEIQIRLHLGVHRKVGFSVTCDANIEEEPIVSGNEPYADAAELLKNPKFKQVADDFTDVGQARVGSLMKELAADKARRQEIIDDKHKAKFIYETICVPYTAISEILNESVRKGFYMVHLHGDDLIESIQVEGPFKEPIEQLDYHETIFENAVTATVESKSKRDSFDVFNILIDG